MRAAPGHHHRVGDAGYRHRHRAGIVVSVAKLSAGIGSPCPNRPVRFRRQRVLPARRNIEDIAHAGNWQGKGTAGDIANAHFTE